MGGLKGDIRSLDLVSEAMAIIRKTIGSPVKQKARNNKASGVSATVKTNNKPGITLPAPDRARVMLVPFVGSRVGSGPNLVSSHGSRTLVR